MCCFRVLHICISSLLSFSSPEPVIYLINFPLTSKYSLARETSKNKGWLKESLKKGYNLKFKQSEKSRKMGWCLKPTWCHKIISRKKTLTPKKKGKKKERTSLCTNYHFHKHIKYYYTSSAVFQPKAAILSSSGEHYLICLLERSSTNWNKNNTDHFVTKHQC